MVTYCSVGRQPHLLELELLHSLFIWSDGRALYAYRVLLDCLGCINGNLIVGLVAVLETQVVVFQIDIEVREDELKWVAGISLRALYISGPELPAYLFLDILPDNAGHLISIELHHRVL